MTSSDDVIQGADAAAVIATFEAGSKRWNKPILNSIPTTSPTAGTETKPILNQQAPKWLTRREMNDPIYGDRAGHMGYSFSFFWRNRECCGKSARCWTLISWLPGPDSNQRPDG